MTEDSLAQKDQKDNLEYIGLVTAPELLAQLHRGGKYGYYWTLENRETLWFPGDKIPSAPIGPKNIYFGVNPTDKKGDKNSRSTSENISRVNCLYGDIDAKQFSNDKKLALSHILALPIQPTWIIDSGGGYHVYWILNTPFTITNEDDRNYIAYVQAAWVNFIGGDPAAKDLARVLRVPGTWNYKYNTPRMVTVIHYNKIFYSLQDLATKLPPPPQPKKYTPEQHKETGKSDIDWAAGLLRRLGPWRCDNYSEWVSVGISLFQLGAAGLDLWDNWSKGSPKYKAGACADKWDTFKTGRRTLGSLYFWAEQDDPGGHFYAAPAGHQAAQPEPPPGIDDIPEPPEFAELEGTAAAPKVTRPNRKTSWSMAELYTTEFPEPNWIVPGIIQEGLVLLAGRPKVGKSWLALQIAGAVGTGGVVFGQKVTQGKVLYLALEDNPRRIKDRAIKIGLPQTALIQFEFTWPGLNQGGLDAITAAIIGGGYRLIVIDTLSRATPGVDHNDQNPISGIMEALHDLSLNNCMTIMGVDHTRKPKGIGMIDPIDDVMGNTGKSKPIDGILAIYKEQGKAGATLKGRGKETQEIDLALTFDPITCSWQSQGDANQLRMTVRRKEILDAVKLTGKVQLAKVLSVVGGERGNLYRELTELVQAGHLHSENLGNKVFYYV